MPGRGIRAQSEMIVAVRELLREPAIEWQHGIVVDLFGWRLVVAHLVMHPRISVMRRIRRWRCCEQLTVPPYIGAPQRQGRKVEIRRLVFLHQDDDSCH